MPWNQVPILQVEDKIIAQSLTICRYLAHEFGLVGSDPWEMAKCDEFADVINDLIPG
jgi:glutathione S-transferase